MKVFLIYCSNFGVAKTAVAQLQAVNPSFKGFLMSSIQNPECRYLEFEEFLIKPLQRVVRSAMNARRHI